MNEILDFDHTALAELISRRWQEDRRYFTLNLKSSRSLAGRLVVAATGEQCSEVALVSSVPCPPDADRFREDGATKNRVEVIQ